MYSSAGCVAAAAMWLHRTAQQAKRAQQLQTSAMSAMQLTGAAGGSCPPLGRRGSSGPRNQLHGEDRSGAAWHAITSKAWAHAMKQRGSSSCDSLAGQQLGRAGGLGRAGIGARVDPSKLLEPWTHRLPQMDPTCILSGWP